MIETPVNIYKPPYRNYNNVICCNCGGVGHLYRHCNHPVTSFGCIVYRLKYDTDNNSIYPEYLMVQRKDSLSFVEFMRGKYDLQNICYLLQLFSNMTEDERHRLETMDFDMLWSALWSSTGSKNFIKEYNISKERFNKLRNGYYIKTATSDLVFIDISYLIENTEPLIDETEWGFPKGRRNFSEDDRRCALREFKEETGISNNNIRFIREVKPLEEVFSGSNKVRYKHVYYIAKYHSYNCKDDNEEFYDPNNKHQAREIKSVRWFNYKEAQNKIREYNVERKELLKRVNSIVMKMIDS